MKRARNKITSITSDQGMVITDQAEIAQEFLEFYKKLIGTRKKHTSWKRGFMDSGPILMEEDAQKICAPVHAAEIKEALFSIPRLKSHGPDGFSPHFSKGVWNMVGTDITNAIKDFFKTRRLLKVINSTYLTLVPKVDNPNVDGDYRLIACCNVIYKTITKVIARRLKSVLHKVISPEQGPGRPI
jgi:hypothetical protein